MATLSEYFDTEAKQFVQQLDQALQKLPLPDAAELHRTVRGLRGTAQMAREERVFRAISAFESVTRALATNALTWSEDVARRAGDTLADVRALVERAEDDDALEARADASVDRWMDSGVVTPFAAAESPGPGSASREFREYAAREVAGIADALDRGVQQLAAVPMDREPLKMILRRQRALLGAARLDEVPVVAEILRAIEDLTRVIAKLDVGVKQEWLDIYRVAREGLKAAIEPLQRDEDPGPSHALSRLRHMREELLERYGAGEAVSAAHESEGLVQATKLDHPPEPVELPAEPPADGDADMLELLDEADDGPGSDDEAPDLIAAAASAMQRATTAAVGAAVGAAGAVVAAAAGAVAETADDGDVVPIDDLCYDRDGALERALELCDVIIRATASDPDAGDAADELFDLIRLARG